MKIKKTPIAIGIMPGTPWKFPKDMPKSEPPKKRSKRGPKPVNKAAEESAANRMTELEKWFQDAMDTLPKEGE